MILFLILETEKWRDDSSLFQAGLATSGSSDSLTLNILFVTGLLKAMEISAREPA